MNEILRKTFGGLSKEYYIRNFIFGLIFPAILLWVQLSHGHLNPWVLVICVLNTPLYPYSRFVYESIIEFIMGKNIFLFAAPLMLIAKLFTMLLCWNFAIFIAPIGLLYLYYYHSKN